MVNKQYYKISLILNLAFVFMMVLHMLWSTFTIQSLKDDYREIVRDEVTVFLNSYDILLEEY